MAFGARLLGDIKSPLQPQSEIKVKCILFMDPYVAMYRPLAALPKRASDNDARLASSDSRNLLPKKEKSSEACRVHFMWTEFFLIGCNNLRKIVDTSHTETRCPVGEIIGEIALLFVFQLYPHNNKKHPH